MSGAAQGSEGCSQLLGEELRLFPSRKVPAFGQLVVVNEVGIRPLRPAARTLIELVGEHAYSDGNLHALGDEVAVLVLPVEARSRDAGVRQPEERNVVENVIARQ